MANKKYTELPQADAITGAEILAMVQDGGSVQGNIDLIKAYFDTLYSPPIYYAKISETQSAGTDAGTFTSGAWQTRAINTEDSDSFGIVSITSNQFVLQAGSYRIKASAPAFTAVNRHKAKLRNVTDGSDVLIGTSEYSTTLSCSRSEVVGDFTIASAKTFEIQHRCLATQATIGLGVASNFGVTEVYTVVEIWKV